MSAPAATPADKQKALVDDIAAAVEARLQAQFAKLSVSVNTVLARVEASAGAGDEKRAVKTAAGTKAAGAKAGGAKAPAANKDEKSKVTNALLFLRYAFKTGLEQNGVNFREAYGTDENLEQIAADEALVKVNKDAKPEEWWSLAGKAIWAKVLTKDEQATIKAAHVAWKEENAREGSEAPLGEDEAADVE